MAAVCWIQCRDCQRASMVDGRRPGRVDVPAGAVDVVDARLSSSPPLVSLSLSRSLGRFEADKAKGERDTAFIKRPRWQKKGVTKQLSQH